MPVAIKGKIKRVTDRAILFEMSGPDMGGLEMAALEATPGIWLPRSQITLVSALVASDTEIQITISDWIAGQKQIRSNLVEDDFVEQYEAVPSPAGHLFYVKMTDTTEHMCSCDTERKAQLIAASLNLTQGKL